MAIKLNFKKIWEFIKEVFEKWIDDKAPKLGAALSFYTIFSLAPLFNFILAFNYLKNYNLRGN